MKYRYKGTVIFLVCSWAFPVFLAAADRKLLLHTMLLLSFTISITVVMILRVYALWARSRKILGILLFIYVPQIISAFVFTGVYDNPDTHFSGMSQSFIDGISMVLNRGPVPIHLVLQ